MEDDGLLLNFATPSSTPGASASKKINNRSNAKVTGGKWKERRKAQLVLEGRGRGSNKPDTKKKLSSANNTPIVSKPKPSIVHSGTGSNSSPMGQKKRSFEKNDDSNNNNNNNDGPAAKKFTKETRGAHGGTNNTYVSSLFTANPDITDRKYDNDDDDNDNDDSKKIDPSNAPLTDSTTFPGLGISDFISNHLTEHLKFKQPTKIQRSVIPKLLNLSNERDLFVQSQTGSGKTLSFVLPIFQRLTDFKELNRQTGLFAIILTPTRELANQIYSVLETLTRCCHRIVPGIVIGGEKKKSEKARLRKGVNILVATPGRLLDHIENTNSLDLSNIRYVVLDEGDKLMELGFEETITNIIKKIDSVSRFDRFQKYNHNLPTRRINILCSATIKGNVKKLGDLALNNAELINSNNDENIVDFNQDMMKAPDQLIQQILVVPVKLRLVTLTAMLKNLTSSNEKFTRTMVFFSCSDSVNFHFISLTHEGKRITTSQRIKKIEESVKEDDDDEENSPSDNENITALTAPLINDNVVIYKLHGSLSQQVRTSTLSHFTKGNSNSNSESDGEIKKHLVLFCTDVAARGLDLPLITNVIEFDPPFAIEDHLHRIGRTARLGQLGLSCLFLIPGDEENYIDKIKPYHNEDKLQFKNYEVVLKTAFAKKKSDDNENNKTNKHGREGNWDVQATTFQLNVERWLLEDPRSNELAVKGFISHLRAYTTHLSSEKDCFNIKKLHMGHLAKSFGLRETPKKLAMINTGNNDKKGKVKEDAKTKMLRIAKMAYNSSNSNSEFNIGV